MRPKRPEKNHSSGQVLVLDIRLGIWVSPIYGISQHGVTMPAGVVSLLRGG